MKGMEGLCYVEVDIGSLEPVHWYEHFFFETFKKQTLVSQSCMASFCPT